MTTEWLDKPAAMKLLGCSERTFERHAKAFNIEHRYRQQGRAKFAEYRREDVEALKARLAEPAHVPALLPAATGRQPTVRQAAADTAAPLHNESVAALVRAALCPLPQKLGLTLAEASLYTGLPKARILEAARAGEIRGAGKIGQRRSWLIWRLELELWCRKLREG